MRQALVTGKARRKVPLRTVTMRLSVPDIEAAQDLAHRRGLPYQTYIKMLLHEAAWKRTTVVESTLWGKLDGFLNSSSGWIKRSRFPIEGIGAFSHRNRAYVKMVRYPAGAL